MSISEYLESTPLTDLVRYHSEQKGEAVPFCGTLRKHPYDADKCILIGDPESEDCGIYEFRVADILAVDEMPLPVTENGSARRLVRLWVQKGCIAIRYEPFEVGVPAGKTPKNTLLHERIIRSVHSHR